MTNIQYAAILVPSTSHALKVEKILKEAAVTCKLIPVPRQLSSDCGVCVRINNSDAHAVKTIIDSKNVTYDGIFQIEK